MKSWPHKPYLDLPISILEIGNLPLNEKYWIGHPEWFTTAALENMDVKGLRERMLYLEYYFFEPSYVFSEEALNLLAKHKKKRVYMESGMWLLRRLSPGVFAYRVSNQIADCHRFRCLIHHAIEEAWIYREWGENMIHYLDLFY